jgi:predicted kinase
MTSRCQRRPRPDRRPVGAGVDRVVGSRIGRTGLLAGVSDARLILMCGLPGSGKTSLAAQLASGRGAVRLTKDEWLWALGATPWDRPTGEKIEQELWRLAQEILSLGLSVVLDFGLWARTERDEMRTVARALGVGVELHYLEVAPDELWRRIEVRNSAPPWVDSPIGRADLDEWLNTFQAPGPCELALFDPPPESH